MKRLMTNEQLRDENREHATTGGRSQSNGCLGFAPAFLDYATFTIHPSRFANGALAPFHVLDGLPDEVVVMRSPCGRVVTAKPSLISGFVRNGFFYTRSAAAKLLQECDRRSED